MAKLEYEASVKIEDNVNPLVKPGELWKAGDITSIHPKGWIWSQRERQHFLIVNVGFLEKSEAEKMTEEITIEETDEDGNVRKKLVARSRYKVNVAALLDKLPGQTKEAILNRDVEIQPFRQSTINPSNIEARKACRPSTASMECAGVANGKAKHLHHREKHES